MKPVYKKITLSESLTYSSSLETPPAFETPWHYHPEYELILIMNSKGTRYMGDNISNFDNRELVLVGPNLPHFWKEFETDCPFSEESFACVIHFTESFLGDKIFNCPEATRIKRLLDNSRFGTAFTIDERSPLINKIIDLIEHKEFNRILGLLNVLDNLSKIKNIKKLSSEGFVNFFNKKNAKKINVTIEYAMTNFRNKICLKEVSELIHMSKSSFCRFFKKSTGKTYFDFIREIRIGYACKLILENNLNITQVGYECGYENISHFSRQFKKTKGIVPLDYRKQTLENNISL
ncbi:MAG: AraC family transcriptional regulator [Flavobacteriaceae bacterium]|nr:AraC family transcriptional regulator [Flavobacteriaceae bacterium]MCY4215894.1 AraC family transcriptional regulator [Flavobacteriaceae bacterium]MCY4253942.1 AraC family transcriptional regulator [Flavobacteriaceae bacterium]